MLAKSTLQARPLPGGVLGYACRPNRRLKLVVHAVNSSSGETNLGELSRFLGSESGAASQQQTLEDVGEWQARVSKDSFSNRGLYVDSSSIFASSILLILLLSLSFQRILGLDKWLDKWLISMSPKAREARRVREEVEAARKRLDSTWADDQDNDEGNSNNGPRK
ncbi:hypothetical protein DUNSADRAFT_16560 [Dunaliella salina]|uniref:Encoded protein n=1 Tax=Dunaliella salina TaxID=3046 RepID=A0ABQ7H0U3_DUNSA|nr:hypothetical protein DUNSADRAFT_16560 [Dunaliella salina]|eukprot:KAF5840469.1 hypothetical protein DUNSADRAFT_16560 [Dunaliella salina]